MIRQSSNFPLAIRALADLETTEQQQAFADGYNHAHGIACHCNPEQGSTVSIEAEGSVLVTEDNLTEVKFQMALECEARARSQSPWEQVASRINNSAEDPSDLWSAYESGVLTAIHHDLELPIP